MPVQNDLIHGYNVWSTASPTPVSGVHRSSRIGKTIEPFTIVLGGQVRTGKCYGGCRKPTERIGLVDPVSISCTTASVRPVIGVPGTGNVCTCLARRSAGRALFAREIARCVEHVEQMGWERAFSCASFGLAGTYVLYGLYFLHARYACTGRNYDWVTFTVC